MVDHFLAFALEAVGNDEEAGARRQDHGQRQANWIELADTVVCAEPHVGGFVKPLNVAAPDTSCTDATSGALIVNDLRLRMEVGRPSGPGETIAEDQLVEVVEILGQPADRVPVSMSKAATKSKSKATPARPLGAEQ